jgi:tetratricopeptide (TPR) repeat protein
MDYETLRKMSNDGGDPQVALNRGEFAEQHGDLEGALLDYSNAIKYKPDFLLAYRYRALVYLNQKKYDLAIKDYLTALTLDNWSLKGLESLCEVLLEINYYNNLLKLAETFVQKYPDNSLGYYYLAFVQTQKKDFINAEKNIDISINLSSTNKFAWDVKAFTNIQLGNFYTAIEDYNKLLELEPKSGITYYNIGQIYFNHLNDKEEGIKNIKIADQLNFPLATQFLIDVDK